MGSSGGIDPGTNGGCVSVCMAAEMEWHLASCCTKSSQEEEGGGGGKEAEADAGSERLLEQQQRESTVGGRLLPLYVTHQEKKLTAPGTRPAFPVASSQ